MYEVSYIGGEIYNSFGIYRSGSPGHQKAKVAEVSKFGRVVRESTYESHNIIFFYSHLVICLLNLDIICYKLLNAVLLRV